MSLETLRIAEDEAINIMGIDKHLVEETRQQQVYQGQITLSGDKLDAFRVHTGTPEGRIAKGGIRYNSYAGPNETKAECQELSGEMHTKLAARGYGEKFRGGKGVVNIAGRRLSPEDKKHIAREFEAFMEYAGLAGHNIDIPAGDVGTNGLADTYAAEYARKHPDNPYAKAVITGKSPENGGLEARAGATGLGVLAAQHELMRQRGVDQASVSLQGFGNVASWYAFFAHSDPQKRVRVQAISELEGALWTPDPTGLPITEDMVRMIGDNKDWTGPKLKALAEMIHTRHPNLELNFSAKNSDIISYPADYFVPAAMGNAITAENVSRLGAKLGVIEAGNGTTTPTAHQEIVNSGRDVVADVGANSGGVDTSIKEWGTNVAMAEGRIASPPSREEVESELQESSARLMSDTLCTAEVLGTRDLRVAVAALAIDRALGINRLAPLTLTK